MSKLSVALVYGLFGHFLSRTARDHEDCSCKSNLYHCNKCPYSTRNSAHLINHIRKHTGERPFQCPKCGQGFSEKGNLNRHLKAHSDPEDTVYYSCILCSAKFKTDMALAFHCRKTNHI